MSIQQLRQQSRHIPVTTHQQSIQTAVTTLEETSLGDIQYILRLLWASQAVSRQTTRIAERLCKEVTSITQGKAQLILQDREGNQITMPSIPTQKGALLSFSVQLGDVTYGMLCIAPDSEQPTLPAIPFVIAQLLAQICSWLLYTFEQSIFLQGQCQHLDTPIYTSLTKREREVLTLMCLGNNQQSIAEKLHISPTTVGKHRQHIYEQLGVHNERDALLAAYRFGLFSILDLPNL
ncbi:MAG TPA: helix-turn-helix transcriptional regulator [Ktedonobacteraceae bacterium]|nr:helix-turn-helix transcriptional regulator [Ktedonobacteraceae bacterium]